VAEVFGATSSEGFLIYCLIRYVMLHITSWWWHVSEQTCLPDYEGWQQGLVSARVLWAARSHPLLERLQQRFSHGSLFVSTCHVILLILLIPAATKVPAL